MKIRITESQYNILVNKPRDVVFGKINEVENSIPDYSPENIRKVASNYTSRNEFKIKNRNFYSAAHRLKMMDKLFPITKIDYSLENVRKVASNYTSRTDFKNKDRNFYEAAKKLNILDELFPKIDYSPENIRKVASQYSTRIDFLDNDRNFYEAALKLNLLDDLFPKNKYSPENIRKVASIYKSRGEFGRKASYFYEMAIKLNMLDELFPKIDYSPENIRKVASKYTSRTEFNNSDDRNFYRRAHILNLIDELFPSDEQKIEWWGEKTIKEILKQKEFNGVVSQHKYNECKNSLSCRQYKFDIYLPYNKNNIKKNKNIPKTGIIFEYDGRQHFEPIEYFGGENKFRKQVHSDREKNLFCRNYKPNPIKLVRIPYTSKTKEDIVRDIELALNDPSTFILTGDYPKAGWNK